MTLVQLCMRMSEVHEWSPLIEIWVDEFGYQRIAMKYSLPTDAPDAELRIFHEINSLKPFDSFNAMVEEFCAECLEGLDS